MDSLEHEDSDYSSHIYERVYRLGDYGDASLEKLNGITPKFELTELTKEDLDSYRCKAYKHIIP